jgi:uncharacterized protein (DUF488 family)
VTADPRSPAAPEVVTVGHSNHAAEHLVALLIGAAIEVLVDVRSTPRSRWSPQFDRAALERTLAAAGVRYLYLGDHLGGRPRAPELSDDAGHVRYDRVAATSGFREALARLERGAASHRVAIMCSEENPVACHRRLLVGRALQADGITVTHLRGDGRLQPDADLTSTDPPAQATLFGGDA